MESRVIIFHNYSKLYVASFPVSTPTFVAYGCERLLVHYLLVCYSHYKGLENLYNAGLSECKVNTVQWLLIASSCTMGRKLVNFTLENCVVCFVVMHNPSTCNFKQSKGLLGGAHIFKCNQNSLCHVEIIAILLLVSFMTIPGFLASPSWPPANINFILGTTNLEFSHQRKLVQPVHNSICNAFTNSTIIGTPKCFITQVCRKCISPMQSIHMTLPKYSILKHHHFPYSITYNHNSKLKPLREPLWALSIQWIVYPCIEMILA